MIEIAKGVQYCYALWRKASALLWLSAKIPQGDVTQ